MEQFNLDNRPKINPGFKVPENYFDNLADRVMQQLPQQEVKVVPLYRRTPVWMSAVAAVFVLLFGISLFLQTNTTTTPQPDDTAIENYLVYQSNINQYDLMQALDDQDIAELESSMAINDEAIEDYLNSQNIYINE